jgi:hypothetical protein
VFVPIEGLRLPKSSESRRDDVTTQVRQTEKSLRSIYLDPGLIADDDIADLPPGRDRDQRMLSRALTAQAVRILTGWSPEEAAKSVTDGLNDQGIDAIAVVEEPDPHVYIVQGKWSDKGKAKPYQVRQVLAAIERLESSDEEN